MTKQRYFRVGAFYRDENSKSVIVQCYDRKEAETWIPRVKAMLYPGENTDNFQVHIFKFKLQINLNSLDHYRITVERPIKREFKDIDEEMEYDNSLYFSAEIEALDENDAKAKFFEDWFDLYSLGNKPEDYEALENHVCLWTISMRAYGYNIATLYGTKPTDLIKCITKIHETLPGQRTICYWHNLSYDWFFIRQYCFAGWGDPVKFLATKPGISL